MKDSQRILFICHDAGRTGAPFVLLALEKWLRQHTHCRFETVLCRRGPLEEEFAAVAPVRYIGMVPLGNTRLGRFFCRRFPLQALWLGRQMRRAFRQGRYDLVYSNTVINGGALEALSRLKPLVITHVHELEYWIRKAGERNLAQVKQHTRAYIAASESVKQNLMANHGIREPAISVVQEFIERVPAPAPTEAKRQARRRLGIPEPALVVGGCGAEYWRKGRDLVVHLLLALKRRSLAQPAHFVWVGKPAAEDEAYAMHYDLRVAGVESTFHFTGEVADPFSFYAAFDAFALLSRDDPFPLVCLEAAAMEIPILCFAGAGGMPELVQEDCGGVVPYLDLEAMAEKLTWMHERPGVRQAMGKVARQRVLSNNVVEFGAPQIWSIIQQIVPPSRPGREN